MWTYPNRASHAQSAIAACFKPLQPMPRQHHSGHFPVMVPHVQDSGHVIAHYLTRSRHNLTPTAIHLPHSLPIADPGYGIQIIHRTVHDSDQLAHDYKTPITPSIQPRMKSDHREGSAGYTRFAHLSAAVISCIHVLMYMITLPLEFPTLVDALHP